MGPAGFFTNIVENCGVEAPTKLLHTFWAELTRDWIRKDHPALQRAEAEHLEHMGVKDTMFPRLLKAIDDRLQQHGKTNRDVNLQEPPAGAPGESGIGYDSRGSAYKLCEQPERICRQFG